MRARRASPSAIFGLPNLFRALLVAAAVVAHSPSAWSQTDAGAAPTGAPQPAAATGGAPAEIIAAAVQPAVPQSTTANIVVRRFDDSFSPIPAAGIPVKIYVFSPPHQIVSSQSVVTDTEGRAVVQVPVGANLEASAEVNEGRRFFSASVPLSELPSTPLEVNLYAVTQDPSVLFASGVQTIVQPWEDYLMVQQVWTFGVDKPVIFQSDVNNRASLVRVMVPQGAEGVRVTEPADKARVVDSLVAFAAEISPAGMTGSQQRPQLILQYSLKTNNRKDFEWSQPLTMDVERMSIVVPQTTEFERHQALDVTVDGLRCDTDPNGFCFTEISENAEGVMLREDVPVVVARGHGPAGSVMTVKTSGWPHEFHWPRYVAVGGSAVVLFFGFALTVREWRARRGGQTEATNRLDQLRLQQTQLLSAAAQAVEQLELGELTEAEHDLAQSRFREQLAVISRLIRELQTASSVSAPPSSDTTKSSVPTEIA